MLKHIEDIFIIEEQGTSHPIQVILTGNAYDFAVHRNLCFSMISQSLGLNVHGFVPFEKPKEEPPRRTPFSLFPTKKKKPYTIHGTGAKKYEKAILDLVKQFYVKHYEKIKKIEKESFDVLQKA